MSTERSKKLNLRAMEFHRHRKEDHEVEVLIRKRIQEEKNEEKRKRIKNDKIRRARLELNKVQKNAIHAARRGYFTDGRS